MGNGFFHNVFLLLSHGCYSGRGWFPATNYVIKGAGM
jgi:hypothetical protein